MRRIRLLTPGRRTLYTVLIVIALLMLLVLAASIPYLWESKSMWYKLGMDKALLRAGKIAGLWAAVLLFFQVVLAQRLTFFDRCLGLDRVFSLHHYNALVIVGLGLIHISLVLVPEGLANLPIGWKFWPELVGAVLLSLLGIVVITAVFRRRLAPYHLWRRIHRPVGYLLLAILMVHVLNVSDSFSFIVPAIGIWSLLVVTGLVSLICKINRFRLSRQRLAPCHIAASSDDVVSLHIPSSPFFVHAPGQFGFLTVSGEKLSAEPHPFTIASAPGESLQFFIKRCGDWTSQLTPEMDAKAFVHGPYGLFSFQAHPQAATLVFIAGGIGITPMLSMLRDLAATAAPVPIILVWSLRQRDEMFLRAELENLQHQLPQLETHLFFTQEPNGRRIDQALLNEVLGTASTSSHFYVCGPRAMMKQTRQHLKALGFPSKNIHWENFSL